MSSTDTIATTASDPTAVVATAQFLTPVVLGLQALTINAKQAHWHVRGANFVGVHELLDTIASNAGDFADAAAERIVALTGTLGVRVVLQPRFIANRETVELDTEWGTITLKHGAGRYRPEHEDVARIARENNLLYHDVLVKISNLTESI